MAHSTRRDQPSPSAVQEPDAPAQPVQLAGSHVLSAVCGHSGSHSVEGTGQQLKKLGSGRYGGHIETAQGVDGGLEDNGADGGDGVLQAHGDSHGAQHPAGVDVQPPFLPTHAEDGIFFGHVA